MVNPSTVVFDVGGTLFKVALSTIQKYPDSMLARMVSEDWANEESISPLFLDGNPERFAVLLDIMRHGYADLDWNKGVSKEMVEKDAAYYGIPFSPETIPESTSYLQRAQILKAQRDELTLELRMIELVCICQTRLATSPETNQHRPWMSLLFTHVPIVHLNPHEIMHEVRGKWKDLRDKYFEEAGLLFESEFGRLRVRVKPHNG